MMAPLQALEKVNTTVHDLSGLPRFFLFEAANPSIPPTNQTSNKTAGLIVLHGYTETADSR